MSLVSKRIEQGFPRRMMIPYHLSSVIADRPHVFSVLFKHATVLLFLGCSYEVQGKLFGGDKSQHLVVTIVPSRMGPVGSSSSSNMTLWCNRYHT